MSPTDVIGDKSRQAIEALGGFEYQLYQTALAWLELDDLSLLSVEVAEDYAVASREALIATQVKRTSASVTINSEGVTDALESLFFLQKANPRLSVRVQFLTTSEVGTERQLVHRVNGEPTLKEWKSLAKSGDLADLRRVLDASKLSVDTKKVIQGLTDEALRKDVLRRISFECGAPDKEAVAREMRLRLRKEVIRLGGNSTQINQCEAVLIWHLLTLSASDGPRTLDRNDLDSVLSGIVRVSVPMSVFEQGFGSIANLIPTGTRSTALRAVAMSELPPMAPTTIDRAKLVNSSMRLLQAMGVVWLHAAAGTGKTTIARLSGRRVGGRWLSAGFRGQDEERTTANLDSIIATMSSETVQGIVVDDLDARSQPAIDAVLRLIWNADRLSIPLVVTSATPPSSKIEFAIGDAASFVQKVTDFDKLEVSDLVRAFGGDDAAWANYVYFVSGGGHPQLTEGVVRNLSRRGWPEQELADLSSLVQGNPAAEAIRAETRQRLLAELQPAHRLLLQRLTLHVGSFKRDLPAAISSAPPPLAEGGLLFEDLVGPWIDQVDAERYQVSPLLAGLGSTSLSADEQKACHAQIAAHLTQRSIDVQQVDSAMLSAFLAKDDASATRIAMAVLNTPNEKLEIVARNTVTLTFARTDQPVWEGAPFVALLLRAAQVLLRLRRGETTDAEDALAAFHRELGREELEPVRSVFTMFLYGKIFISAPGYQRQLPRFTQMIEILSEAVTHAKVAIEEHREDNPFETLESQGMNMVGFAFITQLNALTKINSLIPAFEFVTATSREIRNNILAVLDVPGFDSDMFVRSAWLAEYHAGTIQPAVHTEAFLSLERIAATWGRGDVAVTCCKFAAIIQDEYGNDKAGALVTLDRGLNLYGVDNPELLRAKAKLHFRAKEYADSLTLSQQVIRGDALTSHVDRAFLGREAGVSAESLGQMGTARELYLYGRAAALDAGMESMKVMATGLLGDAALASWHDGDRKTCVLEYATFLRELETIDPSSSLQAAHCRAIGQHVLLWLDQQVSPDGKVLEDGNLPQIYPACISNPEPHADIGKRETTPIDIAWYLLARVDTRGQVGAGIEQNLDSYLPRGRMMEGEWLLTTANVSIAVASSEPELFARELSRFLRRFAFIMSKGGPAAFLSVRNPTPGVFPVDPSVSVDGYEELAQHYVLTFLGASLAIGEHHPPKSLFSLLQAERCPPSAVDFWGALEGNSSSSVYNLWVASILNQAVVADSSGNALRPAEFWRLTALVARSAALAGSLTEVGPSLVRYVTLGWQRILSHQRFLLASPSLYEGEILRAFADDSVPVIKLERLLRATVQVIGGDTTEARKVIDAIWPPRK